MRCERDGNHFSQAGLSLRGRTRLKASYTRTGTAHPPKKRGMPLFRYADVKKPRAGENETGRGGMCGALARQLKIIFRRMGFPCAEEPTVKAAYSRTGTVHSPKKQACRFFGTQTLKSPVRVKMKPNAAACTARLRAS